MAISSQPATEAGAPAQSARVPSSSFVAGHGPLVLLFLLAVLPYVGVLRNDFAYIYDDKAQIIDNPYVHSLGHLREALTTPVWSFAESHGVTNYYRPVMTIGFLLCFQIFGPMALGFHLASLLLHAAVVLVLFFLAERLLGRRDAAWGAACLFALHPIHVESVAWISDVTDLEVTFFVLLAFYGFLVAGECRGSRQTTALAAMTVAGALAFLSKESALSLVLLAAVYEHFYRGDRAETNWRQKLGRYAALWLVAVAYLVVRIRLMGTLGHSLVWSHLTAAETCFSAFALLGSYVGKLIWPAHLSAFYVFVPSTRIFSAPVLAGVLALLVCVLMFAALWRTARPASFGLVWFLATLAPVLDARLLGRYVFCERYLYLPSVGFCLLAGWALARLWQAASGRETIWRRAVMVGCGLAAALCVFRIATRIPDWHDDVTLISRALAAEPKEFILHDALGDAYWMRNDYVPAEQQWKEALRINPNFVRPYNALGALYGKQKRYGQAAANLERALALNPNDADAHLNLGAMYAEMGHTDEAEKEFRASLALAPLNYAAHNVLGKLYFDAGRLDEAEEQFRESLQCDPNLAALDYLGYVDERRGNNDGAEKAFQAALTLNPADSHAHLHLGLVYASTGRYAQAREELQAARAADPRNPEIQSAWAKLPK